jgi:hypothetical protein
MRVVLLSALLLCACRISLDTAEEVMDAPANGRSCPTGTSTSCLEAESAMHADFTFIKTSIFPISCSASSSCHMSATSSGKLDLSSANAYTSLMGPNGTGAMSNVDKTRMLVVPGQPKASYFFFLIHGVDAEDGEPPFSTPPSTVGFMPQRNKPICCQKIDAIERWITAGAKND